MILALLQSAGCKKWFPGNSDSTPVVASYKNIQLTRHQLSHFVPDDVSPEDSTRYAKYYIDQWVKEQAVADVALTTIKELEDQIEFKVEDYRNKLILHEYTSLLIKRNLDSNVSNIEIQNYYDTEKETFSSSGEYYCYYYVVTANQPTQELAKLMRSEQPEDFPILKKWVEDNALKYKLDSVYLEGGHIDALNKGAPINLKYTSEGNLFRWQGVKQGERRKYFFKMLDIVKPGDRLPMNMVKDEVKTILLNHRKVKLIEDTEERILRDAKARNHISLSY